MSEEKLNFWQTLSSVLAAFFGVQSSKNRHRDFSKGRFIHFAIVAVMTTLILLLIIYAIVRTVLA